MRSLRGYVVVLLVLGLGLSAPPSAAVAWLPPGVVAQHYLVLFDTVQVAADGQGALTAVWVAQTEEGDTQVWTATRPAGATTFGEPVALSEPGEVDDPRVAVNPSGAAAVIWSTVDLGNGAWYDAATRASATAEFTDATSLWDPDSFLLGADVVIDDDGTATAAFSLLDGTFDGPVRATSVAAGSTDWASAEPISVDPVSTDPRLTVDADGRVTAVWRSRPDSATVVQASDLVPGGSWSEPETLSDPEEFTEYPVVSANAAGRAVVAWATDPAAGGVRVRAAFREPDAAVFGDALDAGPRVRSAVDLDVVLDTTGTATVAWVDNRDHLWISTGSSATTFSSQVLDGAHLTSPDFPTVAVAPDGAVTVAWIDERDDDDVVVASRRPAGGTFAPVAQLDRERDEGSLDNPVAVAEPGGDVTVAYGDHISLADDVDYVRASVLDVTAPALTGVTVPGSGTIGAAVSMSASATDRWSGPPSLSWDFGDGATATGAAVSHAYTGAGTFPVKVTATDGAGNITTTTRTLTVPAATDTTAPVLSRARLKPALLPTGKGAKLKVTSSEAAAVVGEVELRRNGRWRDAGSKQWRVEPGRSTLKFYGKAAQRRLDTGKYRVRLVATDGAGNESKQIKVSFRVERG